MHESTKENCFVDRTVNLSKASRGVDYSAEKREACFVILSLTCIVLKPSPAGCFIDCEHALIIGGLAQGLEQHELARGM